MYEVIILPLLRMNIPYHIYVILVMFAAERDHVLLVFLVRQESVLRLIIEKSLEIDVEIKVSLLLLCFFHVDGFGWFSCCSCCCF